MVSSLLKYSSPLWSLVYLDFFLFLDNLSPPLPLSLQRKLNPTCYLPLPYHFSSSPSEEIDIVFIWSIFCIL